MTISDPLWDEREASVNHQHFNMLKTHTEVQWRITLQLFYRAQNLENLFYLHQNSSNTDFHPIFRPFQENIIIVILLALVPITGCSDSNHIALANKLAKVLSTANFELGICCNLCQYVVPTCASLSSGCVGSHPDDKDSAVAANNSALTSYPSAVLIYSSKLGSSSSSRQRPLSATSQRHAGSLSDTHPHDHLLWSQGPSQKYFTSAKSKFAHIDT